MILACLSGCAAQPEQQVIVKTNIVKIYPPKQLLVNCEEPQPPEKPNYRDLAGWIVNLSEVLKECNSDKEKLREWTKDKLIK